MKRRLYFARYREESSRDVRNIGLSTGTRLGLGHEHGIGCRLFDLLDRKELVTEQDEQAFRLPRHLESMGPLVRLGDAADYPRVRGLGRTICATNASLPRLRLC